MGFGSETQPNMVSGVGIFSGGACHICYPLGGVVKEMIFYPIILSLFISTYLESASLLGKSELRC